MVWLGENNQSGERVAIKQFPTGKKAKTAVLESCKSELKVGQMINDCIAHSSFGI